ncbi:MAG: FtsX-like permease family protein, partial [Phycisphaerae bacterium]
LDVVVLYLPEGSRVRLAVTQGITTKLVLSGWVNPNDFKHKGNGYVVGSMTDPTTRQTLRESMRQQAEVEAAIAREPFDEDQWLDNWEQWYQQKLEVPGWTRNLSLPMTSLYIARDMLALAERRQNVYREFGIKDRMVAEAVDRARFKYQQAEKTLEEHNYQAATGAAREAWGILVKSYVRIMDLGREAVFSVVVLMGLLLPAAVFLEKLLIGRKGIVGKLVGTTVIFVAGATFLNFFHPGFRISVSPFIIMIAFTMILMSVIVLVISYQRFDVLLRRARAAGGEVESEEISLTSSLATALSLGVSNLKKRPARTFLTIFTVTVLTFSIVTFVSVRGQDRIDLRPISLDDDLEGRKIDPIPPKYTGVLFREFYWLKMEDNFVDAVKTEFGSRYDVAVRGHRIEVEGGNNAAREGKNQEKIFFPEKKKTWIATGIMSFEPIERKFSHLHEAVSHNEWFRDENVATGEPADRNVIILPDNGAAQLGITEEMIFEKDPNGQWQRRPQEQLPLVRLMNRNWRVIGILDTDLANRMRDVNGKSLAMVDYLRSAFASGAAGEGDLANEPQSYHMRWEDLVIVPWTAATDAKVFPRGVAVRLREPRTVTVEEGQTLTDLSAKYLGHASRSGDILEANAELEEASDLQPGMEIRIPGDDTVSFRQDVALRINKSMYGQLEDGQIALITTQSKQSVAGLAKIIVPVILCVLIVLNTMMANVEERRGEVGMLGAIGLSPSQISFLLLSESTVFSVLGIVFGTFIGLLFANIADAMGAFQSLSFNFTSLLSMALAMGTGVVVLVATLVPARRAAAMAAPSGMAQWELPEPSGGGNIRFDLPFTLTRGNAVGMMAFFRRFLLNHTDAASPDFNCRDIALDVIDSDEEQALVISARMWLSPYDLDVAQDFLMKVVPTESEGVFSVVIQLHRTSGTEDAWLRTNYGFMDLVRRQFLLWRNLNNDARTDYIAEGAQLFQEAAR